MFDLGGLLFITSPMVGSFWTPAPPPCHQTSPDLGPLLVVVVHSTGSKTAGLQFPPTPSKSRAAQPPKPPAGQPPLQGPTKNPCDESGCMGNWTDGWCYGFGLRKRTKVEMGRWIDQFCFCIITERVSFHLVVVPWFFCFCVTVILRFCLF